jgi:hypothetical protein
MATLTALAMLVTVASVDGAGVAPAAAVAMPAVEDAPDEAPELEVAVEPVQRDWVDRVMDCLAWAESRNVPTAVNPRSGASGLFQFLLSTWMTTPQGRAGYSRFDPVASREATRWMIGQNRGREWSTWWMCA